MEIVPNKPRISVNWNALQTGSELADNTKQSLEQLYDEIAEINGCVIAELAGDVRKTYLTVSERTEGILKNVCGNFEKLSGTIEDFKFGTMKIDSDAETQAGGKTNG